MFDGFSRGGAGELVGTLDEVRRYPVKSMLGEELEQVALTERGVVGDRAYALVDEETGKVVSVKRPRSWRLLPERLLRRSAWDPSRAELSASIPEVLHARCLQADDPLAN